MLRFYVNTEKAKQLIQETSVELLESMKQSMIKTDSVGTTLCLADGQLSGKQYKKINLKVLTTKDLPKDGALL